MQSLFYAGLAGMLGVAGWSPLALWPLALLAYAILFRLLRHTANWYAAAGIGLSYGLMQHVAGHGWMLATLHDKAGLSLLAALPSTAIFLVYLALFTAVPCGLWGWGRGAGHARAGAQSTTYFAACSEPLAGAALLTLGEWMRSQFFHGFTSLSLGLALTDSWLSGYAPVIGLYGLSWIGYVLAVSFCLRRCAIALMAAIFLLGAGLGMLDWVAPAGTPLSYRLLQSQLTPAEKLSPDLQQAQITALGQTLRAAPATLIVTTETAFPVPWSALPASLLDPLAHFSDVTGSHFFLGAITLGAQDAAFNSVVHLAPGERQIARYDKVGLMAFGEYSPVGFGWFSSLLSVARKDLRAGTETQPPFAVGQQHIGVLICQEDMTSLVARKWMPMATVLINPSNLAWFEGSNAISQGLHIARMRAIEVGRPILRAANGGLSAHIDHRGALMQTLPERQQGELRGMVQGMRGSTPFSRWGDWPVLLGCIALVLTRYFRHRRKR